MKHPIMSDARLAARGADYFSIGCTPCSEDCVQVGINWTSQDNLLECEAYMDQLIRRLGPVPSGCLFFALKNTGHEFGTYYEAAILLSNPDDQESSSYAFSAEAGDDNWDAEAIQFLRDSNYGGPLPAPIVNLNRKSA